MKKILSLLSLSALLFAGCANHGYVNPNSVHFDKASNATIYDIKTAVSDLVEKMQDDEAFKDHYDMLSAKKGETPVLQIGNIVNNTEERILQKLNSARRRLEIALRKTRLFEITDDADSAESVSETLAVSITKNVELGLKNDDNMQAFGTHKSADYQMYGKYRSFQDGDRHTYELTLQLIDIKTGLQVWSDIAEIAKE